MTSASFGAAGKLRSALQTSLGPSFAIENELGGGGMSRVFIAADTRLGRHIVVKVLAPDLVAAPGTHTEDASDGDHGGLTATGLAIGTPAYMAPEQAVVDPRTDHRADLYAFGCVAYEVLAGEPVFRARTPQELAVAHLVERPR